MRLKLLPNKQYLFAPEGDTNPRLLFLMRSDGGPPTSDTLDLVDSWGREKNLGHYIFLDQWRDLNEGTLRLTFQNFPDPQQGGICWLYRDHLDIFQFGLATRATIQPISGDLCKDRKDPRDVYDVEKQAQFANAWLETRTAQVALCPDKELLEIADATIRIKVEDDTLKVPVPGVVQIPLSGTLVGKVRFSVSFDDSALEALDVGFRYFASGGVKSCRFPVFHTTLAAPPVPLRMRAQLDFLPAGTLQEQPPVLEFEEQEVGTFFCTIFGQPMNLTAKKGAGFKLAARLDLKPGDTYFQPCGPFELKSGDAPVLLCGLSGAEYCKLPIDAQIVFEPDRPAWILPSSIRSTNGPFLLRRTNCMDQCQTEGCKRCRLLHPTARDGALWKGLRDRF